MILVYSFIIDLGLYVNYVKMNAALCENRVGYLRIIEPHMKLNAIK